MVFQHENHGGTNEISDTPVVNDEATDSTPKAGVDKEQPSGKPKGSSKTMDKRKRTSSSSADSASGDESSESDSSSEGDSETAP